MILLAFYIGKACLKYNFLQECNQICIFVVEVCQTFSIWMLWSLLCILTRRSFLVCHRARYAKHAKRKSTRMANCCGASCHWTYPSSRRILTTAVGWCCAARRRYWACTISRRSCGWTTPKIPSPNEVYTYKKHRKIFIHH